MCADVWLAQPCREDADEFIEAVRSSRPLQEPWVFPADTPERFAAYLESAAGADRASYLIRHAECGGLVGFANISNIVRGSLQSGYLGYGAFASHAGRGLMTAGLSAVVGAAFRDLGLHRVEANIQPDNTRSLAIAGRLGFRREGFSPRYLYIDGEWRDHERWALLAEDWASPEAEQ
jgi:[ribosomal protein S5]-alanine N-acetyltransferase